VDDAETYAELGIPEPAPCPPWCQGKRGGSHAGPSGAVIFHGASAIGGGGVVVVVVVDSQTVTLGMNWAERFDGGAWQRLRDRDVTVFPQVGMDYIPVDATDRNMAGLAAVARLISPGVSDRVGQVEQLLKETRGARQAIPQ
jgi:hypothetical protein